MVEKNIILFARNSTSSHPVLRNIITSLSSFSEARLNVLKITEFGKLWTLCKKKGPLIIITEDPFSYLLAKIIGLRAAQIFFSLELYEHQVPNNSLRSLLRNFLFLITHKISLRTADLVVFPSLLRASYYRGVRRQLILQNKPLQVSAQPSGRAMTGEDRSRLEEFVHRHQKVVIFAGGLNSTDLLKEFLGAVSEEPRIGVVLILSREVPEIKRYQGEHVIFFSKWSHEAVLDAYELCDVGLLLYENYPLNKKYCAPVKIYEYLNADLGVIGNGNYSLLQNPLVDKVYQTPDEIVPALLSSQRKTGTQKTRHFLDDDMEKKFLPEIRLLLSRQESL